MIRWLNKKMKSEKGAISAFALMSMAFFLIFIVSIFIYFARRESTQAETLRLLADKYNDKTEEDVVSTLVSNEADVVPIYTLEQLKEIGSDKYITIPQADGKIYKFSRQEDIHPDDGSEGRARYKLMQNWSLDELTVILADVVSAWSSDKDADMFVGLESNQALGMYIVNFPNVTAGKLVVKKEIVAFAPRAGQYDAEGSKFVYKITISNAGIVDVDNIQIKDIMTRKTTVEGNTESGDVELSVYKNQSTTDPFVLSNEVVQTFTLETPIQDDGTERQTKGVTWDEWYVIYVTDDDDVSNKNTLKNTVTVKGSTSGVSTIAKAESPEVIYGEQQGYDALEDLIIWYEGIDNMAGSLNQIDVNNEHNSSALTWKDKDIEPQATDASIILENNNNSRYWINGKSFWFRENETGRNGKRYRRGVTFNDTDELKSVIGNVDGKQTHEFSMQLAFQLDLPRNESESTKTIYTFGKDNTSRNAYSLVYDVYNEQLQINGPNEDVTITANVKSGVPYVVVIQGKYKWNRSGEQQISEGIFWWDTYTQYYDIYDLEWEAYIKNANTDELQYRSGTRENFETITYEEDESAEDNAKFGFRYNMIGKDWNNNYIPEMYFHGFKLYDRMLTQEEVTTNINVDVNRLF